MFQEPAAGPYIASPELALQCCAIGVSLLALARQLALHPAAIIYDAISMLKYTLRIQRSALSKFPFQDATVGVNPLTSEYAFRPVTLLHHLPFINYSAAAVTCGVGMLRTLSEFWDDSGGDENTGRFKMSTLSMQTVIVSYSTYTATNSNMRARMYGEPIQEWRRRTVA
jgi:hypothetical protein